MNERKHNERPRGFSLIELMVAMGLLAIGILAVMAMQASTLQGYTAAREATGSTELARTVEQIIRAEARGWDSGSDAPGDAGNLYDEHDAIFAKIMGNTGSWTRIYDEPVTQRFNGEDIDEDAEDDTPRRFCVYAFGEQIDTEAATAEQTPDYVRVGLAVVYPTGQGTFDDGCPAADGGIALDSQDREALELEGLRATHFSTGFRAANTQFH